MDLFDHAARHDAPLAERMRPRRLAEVVGQRQLVGPDALLARLVKADRVPSILLWGPPGTGKTTLAHVLARETTARFVPFNAVLAGVPVLRKLLAEADEHRKLGERTLLFVDEIHRFNKGQQDALLPHVERGTVALVGATTENPSFSVNSALISRAKVFRLEPLAEEDLEELIRRALRDPRGVPDAKVEDAAIAALAGMAGGDARRALTMLELLTSEGRAVDLARVEEAFTGELLRHDRAGDDHYDVTSALIKSLRGSDPDAGLYWMMRLLEAGEDPRFVLRRLLIFASEDIGNADPRALQVAVAADQAFARLGMPEAMHALAQCCTYLAVAPKSNASYRAFRLAREAVHAHGALPVPNKLRNAPTILAKSMGHGEAYRYPHDEGGYAPGETYLPEKLVGARFYMPSDQGFERRIRDRLDELLAADRAARGEADPETG